MTVSDNNTQAEGLRDFFENLVNKGLIVSEKMAKMILKIFDELWISQQTWLPQLQKEIPKM